MALSRKKGKGILESIQGFMFDLDGTLVLSDKSLSGYKLLPHAVEVLTELQERGIPFVTATNGTAYPVPEQAPKLRALGLPIPDTALITPSSVAAELMPRHSIKRALVLGVPGVGVPLSEAGIQVFFAGQKDAEDVDAVYIGWHPECGMRDIEAAVKAIWNGAKLYVASDVPFFATAGGKTMGYSYAITAAVRRMTHAPMILTGKPSLHALRLVAKKLGVPMRKVAVVGDDPLVDMIMARRGGAVGLGVTTGITQAQEWMAQPLKRRPHRVLHDLRELLDLDAFRRKSSINGQ